MLTNQYPTDSDGTLDPSEPLYGFADTARQAVAEEIAPIVTIAMSGSASDVIERTTEFAMALGADADGVVADSRIEFDSAAERLTAAGGRGVTVMVLYAEPSKIYIAKAPDAPSLRMYAELAGWLEDARTVADG